jgi:hypothetical protein
MNSLQDFVRDLKLMIYQAHAVVKMAFINKVILSKTSFGFIAYNKMGKIYTDDEREESSAC